jgi:hypothetical protein
VGFLTVPSHALNEDGSRVFFSSPDPLVPGATNGVRNVYEYEHGSLYLLSDGNGAAESLLVGVSSDGSDVIIGTAESLIAQDENNGDDDLYDVRVDGGFPAPVVPTRCEGDACQGPPAPAPTFRPPLSAEAPAREGVLASTPAATSRTPTRAQRLAEALRRCKRAPKGQRHACTIRAHRRYGAAGARRAAHVNGRLRW